MKINWKKSLPIIVIGCTFGGYAQACTPEMNEQVTLLVEHAISHPAQISEQPEQKDSSVIELKLDTERYEFKHFHAMIFEEYSEQNNYHASL